VAEINVLYWTVAFFVLTIFAALFGFSGIAMDFAGAAKILFVIFFFLFTSALTLDVDKAHMADRTTHWLRQRIGR
jgi:uncharacterized membrane protein YtjA (UPF0391 family)